MRSTKQHHRSSPGQVVASQAKIISLKDYKKAQPVSSTLLYGFALGLTIVVLGATFFWLLGRGFNF
jgi:hypothetical protein